MRHLLLITALLGAGAARLYGQSAAGKMNAYYTLYRFPGASAAVSKR